MSLTSDLSEIDGECRRAVVNYCLNNTHGLKERIYAIIKRLNVVLSQNIPTDYSFRPRISQLCSFMLKLYDAVKRQDSTMFTASEKLQWIDSRLYGNVECYPYMKPIGDFKAIPGGAEVNLQVVDGTEELHQGSLSNCSFVAAVQAITKVSPELLHGDLLPASAGSYSTVFHANGCERSYVVDGKPLDGGMKAANESLMWPQVIEKAFLQLHGASKESEFTGSNFADDCFVLTGFVPEYLPVDRLTKAKLDKLKPFFEDGSLLMALGVGTLTDEEILKFNLVPEHDYSISKLITTSTGGYRIRLRNPSLPLASSCFELSLDDIYDRFRVLYLSWNTDKMFRHKQARTFMGTPRKHELENDSLFGETQFIIQGSSEAGKIWILLERHIDQEDHDVYNTIEWYDCSYRLASADESTLVSRTPLSNSRFTLCRVDMPASGNLIGVLRHNKYEDCPQKQFYSFYVYSLTKLTIGRTQNRFEYTTECTGSWSATQNGGNWTDPDYTDNPQYEVSFEHQGEDSDPQYCTLALFAFRDLHVSLTVFGDGGEFKRVISFDKYRLATSVVGNQSQEYAEGFSIFRGKLYPGKKYRVVCSPYHKEDVGNFKLAINSPFKAALKPICNSMGTYRRVLEVEGPWSTQISLQSASKLAVKVASSHSTTRATLEGWGQGKGQVIFMGSQRTATSKGTYRLSILDAGNCRVEVGADKRFTTTEDV